MHRLFRMIPAIGFCVALVVAGCGTPIPEGSVIVRKTQVRELERRGAEVKRCRKRLGQAGSAHHQVQLKLEASQRRVALLERRVGIGPFTPTHLGAAGDWKLTLPKVRVLEAHGGKARKTSLGKLLGGHRAVVLSYWATWCKPCTSPAELAHLKTLQTALGRYNAALVSFAVDGMDKVTGDPRAPTWHYPLAQRNNGHLESLPQALMQKAGVGLPLFVVVDASGRVAWLRKGKLDEDVIAELVTAAARVGR